MQELLLSTGPFSWQKPLIFDTPLDNHASSTVAVFLSAIYTTGIPPIPSAEESWRLYRLADQLVCPSIMQHCKDYINSSSRAALLHTSAATVDWYLAADKLGLADLRKQCAAQIAKHFLAVSDSSQLQQLSPELLLPIMQSMAQQKQQFGGEVMTKVKAAMLRRSGRATCYVYSSCSSEGTFTIDHKFYCSEIECPGHSLRWQAKGTSQYNKRITVRGTYDCHKADLNICTSSSRSVVMIKDHRSNLTVIPQPELPKSVCDILAAGYEKLDVCMQ